MKNVRDRWHRTLVVVIEDQPPEEAADTILLLLGRYLTQDEAAPEPPKAAPKAPSEKPRITSANSEAASAEKRGLSPLATRMSATGECLPYEWFTCEEAATYLGVGGSRIYQLLRAGSSELVYEKVKGERREEFRLRGRELNVFRSKRMGGDGDGDEDEDEGGPSPDGPRATAVY